MSTLEWVVFWITLTFPPSLFIGMVIHGCIKYPLEGRLYIFSSRRRKAQRKEQKYQQWKVQENARQHRLHDILTFRKRYEQE